MCGAKFTAKCRDAMYCSPRCRSRASSGWTGGLQVHGPKTYKEIKAHNRAHPLKGGWRGGPCMGWGRNEA